MRMMLADKGRGPGGKALGRGVGQESVRVGGHVSQRIPCVAAAAQHCTGVCPTDSSAKVLQLDGEDVASIFMRQVCLRLGQLFERTNGRRAPASRRLANDQPKLETLLGSSQLPQS